MAEDQPSLDRNPERSKLFSLYIYELWWLSSGIVSKTDSIFEKTKIPETGHYIQVDPEIHSLISQSLTDAANIKKLIITPSAKLNGESSLRYKFRKNRGAILKSLTSGLELDEILNSKVRNTLEHFDEYLDEANIELDTKTAPAPMAAYNMTISSWEATTPRLHPIRLYVSSERTFHNLKWSISLQKLHDEALRIKQLCDEIISKTPGDSPGGLMIPL